MTTHDRPEDPEGASPLTRGKLRAALDSEPHSGRIPAHAGKTTE